MDSTILVRAFLEVRDIVQHGPVTLNHQEVIDEVRRLKAAEHAPVTHDRNLYTKLEVRNLYGAVAKANQLHLT